MDDIIRVFYIMAWAFFYVLIFSPSASALLNNNQQVDQYSASPMALVVKYTPDVRMDQGYDKNGTALTNNSELNAFNNKYAIKRQDPVLSRTVSPSDDNPLMDTSALMRRCF